MQYKPRPRGALPNLTRRLCGGLRELYARIAATQQAQVAKSRPLYQKPPRKPGSFTVSEGFLMFSSDLPLFDGRYKVLAMLGQGTFSQLFLAEDSFSAARRRVALKVMNTRYTYVGTQECERVAALNGADPRGKFSVVRFLHAFYFDEHLCMVLELLDCTLLEYMKRYEKRRVPLDELRQIALQVVSSLAFLKQQNMVHADVKPENLLLTMPARNGSTSASAATAADGGDNGSAGAGGAASAFSARGFGSLSASAGGSRELKQGSNGGLLRPSARSQSPRSAVHLLSPPPARVKLIDFGNAMRGTEVSLYFDSFEVCTLYYRPPEVLMRLPFSFPVDMWSLGCVLVELACGRPLFECFNTEDLLKGMLETLGPLPSNPYRSHVDELFGKRRNALYDERNKEAVTAHAIARRNRLAKLLKTTDRDFVMFVMGLLEYDPELRLSPEQALMHPFFDQPLPFLTGDSKHKSALASLLPQLQSPRPISDSLSLFRAAAASQHNQRSASLSGLPLLNNGASAAARAAPSPRRPGSKSLPAAPLFSAPASPAAPSPAAGAAASLAPNVDDDARDRESQLVLRPAARVAPPSWRGSSNSGGAPGAGESSKSDAMLFATDSSRGDSPPRDPRLRQAQAPVPRMLQPAASDGSAGSYAGGLRGGGSGTGTLEIMKQSFARPSSLSARSQSQQPPPPPQQSPPSQPPASPSRSVSVKVEPKPENGLSRSASSSSGSSNGLSEDDDVTMESPPEQRSGSASAPRNSVAAKPEALSMPALQPQSVSPQKLRQQPLAPLPPPQQHQPQPPPKQPPSQQQQPADPAAAEHGRRSSNQLLQTLAAQFGTKRKAGEAFGDAGTSAPVGVDGSGGAHAGDASARQSEGEPPRKQRKLEPSAPPERSLSLSNGHGSTTSGSKLGGGGALATVAADRDDDDDIEEVTSSPDRVESPAPRERAKPAAAAVAPATPSSLASLARRSSGASSGVAESPARRGSSGVAAAASKRTLRSASAASRPPPASTAALAVDSDASGDESSGGSAAEDVGDDEQEPGKQWRASAAATPNSKAGAGAAAAAASGTPTKPTPPRSSLSSLAALAFGSSSASRSARNLAGGPSQPGSGAGSQR